MYEIKEFNRKLPDGTERCRDEEKDPDRPLFESSEVRF